MPEQFDDQDEISIDLRELFLKVWRGKWIIAVCVVIAGAFGLLTVSQMEPTYKASAKVMFGVQKANVVNLQEVLTDPRLNTDPLENEIEVLQSTNLIERVVDALKLDQSPEFNPRLRVVEETLFDRIRAAVAMPPEIGDLLMDAGIKSPPPPPPDPAEAARRERLNIIERVLAGLELNPVGFSSVIEISYTSGNPRTAARIVNAIADQYIVDQLEAKLEATRAATSWLSTRVEELQVRVQSSEEAVERMRAELSLDAGQSLDITQQQLEALNASLSVARNATAQAGALYGRLRAAVDNGEDLGAINEFRRSALIQSYRQTETDLMSQQITLRNTVPEGHPARVRLEAQLGEVRRNLQAEAERIVSAAKIDWDSAMAQEVSLEQEVRMLESQALEQSRSELQLRQLEREAQASRVLYENFLGRLKETSEQEDLQSADARVLSPAEPPLFAESQAKKRTVLLALILGATAGVGIIFLLDKLNNTFRAPMQVETMTGETVLATVPAIGTRVRRGTVIKTLKEKPGSSLAESIRNLRTSILLSNVDNPPKVVMFTSSVPREGKSTTSMLMAMTSRQMGKSAIIVDCDLRMPALAQLVNAGGNKAGLLSVLEGTANLSEAIFVDPETDLHVLMTNSAERKGTINAADVLSSKRFQDLITHLAARYDLVMLDSPPSLVVTDARILSSLADAVIYAVRWDKTPRGAVLEGLKEMRSVNAPLAGIVLTMVNEAKASRYSYDGYRYYKGKYRDYYGT